MATKNPVAKTTKKEPGTQLVDYKAQLAALAGSAKQVEDALQQSPAISFKSGVMSYQDAAITDNTLPVVVVDYALENAYYEGDFDPDAPQSPVCFAFGTGAKDEVMAPHPDSASPQHTDCKGCKHNVFGTAERGAGKRCKNVRRLALVHDAAIQAGAKEVQSTVLATAKLSVTSAPIFGKYVQNLAGVKHVHPIGVVSQMTCAPHKKNQFEITWKFVRDIADQGVLAALFARREEAHTVLFRPYPKNAEVAKPAAKKAAAKGAKNRKY